MSAPGTMAAMNKCLARSNKSGMGTKATKNKNREIRQPGSIHQ